MADEAIVTDLLGNDGDRISYTVDVTHAIEKHSLMVLTDPRTAIIHAAVDTPFIGILAAEKVANDGVTQVSLITNCIAKLIVAGGGSTTIGDDVALSGTVNKIDLATGTDKEKGWVVGKALEDGAAGESVLVRINALS